MYKDENHKLKTKLLATEVQFTMIYFNIWNSLHLFIEGYR